MDDIERRTPREQLDRNDGASNEQSAQSHLRPIPGVFPRYPYVVHEAYNSIPRNESIDNFPQLVPQLDSPPQQVPYFTTIVQPVGLAVASSIQPTQQRILYAQQPVQGIALRPCVNQVYYQGVPQATSPYQYGVRYPSQQREPSFSNHGYVSAIKCAPSSALLITSLLFLSAYTPPAVMSLDLVFSEMADSFIRPAEFSYMQTYRAKPGSVYGIPPEHPRSPTPSAWDNRCRPYDLLFQPEAMRVFNDYKNGLPSPKDKKKGEKQKIEPNKSKTDGRSNGTVHIGGILTLPKNCPTYNDESSQNSTASSVKDDELKPAYMQPGIMLFRKLAQAGFKDLKKTIVKYGVKSSKDDLESLCDEVRAELRSPHTGVLQMEPVLREIILAYIRICSSWSNLVSVLPMMREQPHPLEDCLSPLVKEFLNWQEVSTTMLQRILDALEILPSEHERCISGLARSSEPRPEPGEDGDKMSPGDSSGFRSVNPCSTPLDATVGYSPLPGYVYQTYPGCDIQLTVPRVELSPNLQLDDPIWAHLYPQLDRTNFFRVSYQDAHDLEAVKIVKPKITAKFDGGRRRR